MRQPFFPLILGLLACNTALAQDDGVTGELEVGMRWLIESCEGSGDQMVRRFVRMEVVDLEKDRWVELRVATFDADMQALDEPVVTRVDKSMREALRELGIEDPETDEIEAAGRQWECLVTDVGGFKTWMARRYPGLLVRSEGPGLFCQLIEFGKAREE